MNRSLPGQTAILLGGIGIGAALMYFLDPDGGARRRSLVRDQAASAARSTSRRVRARTADARNRARGTAAELRGMRDDHPADDQLVERVRAELGHRVNHVGAVQVSASDGQVTLRGPVLREELDDVLAAVRGVRGVHDVQNELDVHATAEGVSALQG